jgi:uncharacterized small protein (DUF1192 family)
MTMAYRIRRSPERLAVALAAAFLLGACATVPAPTEQMAVSKAAVTDAVTAGAGEFAPSTLAAAQDKLNKGMAAMNAHDYDAARRYAEEAEVDARLAALSARSAKARLAVRELETSIAALREEIARARRL